MSGYESRGFRQRRACTWLLLVVLGIAAVGRKAASETENSASRASARSGASDPYMAKALRFVEQVINDPKEPEARRLNAVEVVLYRNLRQFKPQVERLATEDPSPVVRSMASRGLEHWKREDAQIAELKTRQEAIRREAAMTAQDRRKAAEEAEKNFAMSLRPQILAKLKSEDEAQRTEIMGSASTWAKYLPETWPVLKNLLRTDRNGNIRLFALMALRDAQPDSPETLSLLRECIGSEYPTNVRGLAAANLSELGDKTGLDVLIGQLSADNVHFQAHTMKSLRGVAMKGDVGPSAALLTKAERPNAVLSEEEKREISEGAIAWQKWWKEARPTFVMPVLRGKTASSRPTTEPGR